MTKTYPRLTEDELPGLRRQWGPAVEKMREQPNVWHLLEEGVVANRAASIRQTLRRYDGIKISQRITASQTYDVYGCYRKDNE